MKKNLFLTFCFSFIPGAGQMYQNYMKRGISLMCLAGILFAIAVMVETVVFIIPFLVVMAYSFFDTYNIRNSIGTDSQIEDEFLFKNFDFDVIKRNRILGIGVLLIGIYILLNNVLYGFVGQSRIISIIRSYFPSIIVAAITIGIGVKMISNNNEK